jgi:hypothetical protein
MTEPSPLEQIRADPECKQIYDHVDHYVKKFKILGDTEQLFIQKGIKKQDILMLIDEKRRKFAAAGENPDDHKSKLTKVTVSHILAMFQGDIRKITTTNMIKEMRKNGEIDKILEDIKNEYQEGAKVIAKRLENETLDPKRPLLNKSQYEKLTGSVVGQTSILRDKLKEYLVKYYGQLMTSEVILEMELIGIRIFMSDEYTAAQFIERYPIFYYEMESSDMWNVLHFLYSSVPTKKIKQINDTTATYYNNISEKKKEESQTKREDDRLIA